MILKLGAQKTVKGMLVIKLRPSGWDMPVTTAVRKAVTKNQKQV